ncbi:hypothetical protein ACFZ8E_19620 [Methylobacterium sp. HMF5984]|uniref:hypothetical protein n=1 Tax=Methylobacterium sp. HMF5984 TaxID=3367370 RepID=UPI00385538FF
MNKVTSIATKSDTNIVQSKVGPLAENTLSGANIIWKPDGRTKKRRLGFALISFVSLVIIPTLIVFVYTSFFASPRYMAEFRFGVRTADTMKSGGFADLFGIAGNAQSGNDANAVVQYLQSWQSINEAEESLPLRQMFSRDDIDYFSRLDANASTEDFVKYWNKLVEPFYETSTGTVTVKVSAYAPADARALAKALLRLSEKLVNNLSERVREDSVRFALGEVSKAETRLSDVRDRLRVVQDREAILDPQKSTEQVLGLSAKLKEEISRRSADLSSLSQKLNEGAPSIVNLRDQINGLKHELQRIESQTTAVGTTGAQNRPLSSVIGGFQKLADEKMFAEKALQSALVTLETSRMNAIKQQIYLSTIVQPGLPQDPVFPRPIKNTLMSFCLCFAIWAIVVMIVASIREHI